MVIGEAARPTPHRREEFAFATCEPTSHARRLALTLTFDNALARWGAPEVAPRWAMRMQRSRPRCSASRSLPFVRSSRRRSRDDGHSPSVRVRASANPRNRSRTNSSWASRNRGSTSSSFRSRGLPCPTLHRRPSPRLRPNPSRSEPVHPTQPSSPRRRQKTSSQALQSKGRGRPRWTREAIVSELATWLLSGTAIDAQFVARYGPRGLVTAARRIFGRFDAAFNLAALHNAKLYPDRPPARGVARGAPTAVAAASRHKHE